MPRKPLRVAEATTTTLCGRSTSPLRLFYKAIELDSDFASAYGMASWCYGWRKINGWMTNPAQETAEAERLARRAAATRGGARAWRKR